ncbi:MAG TPA: PilZ domain-containing protein [Kofleriaceae bacterium]|nr:PilZ domain-containing protein [Kofleriaceae bacterium]
MVTSNNAEIFRHLGARPLQSGGVDHTVVTSNQAALEMVHTKRPQVAIFDVDLAGGGGYSLCRAIKDDPELHDVRVILVLTSVVTRDQLQKLAACGCDDVLALPIHSDDFFHHIVNVAGIPHRRNERIDVGLDMEILLDGQEIPAHVDNVSLGGVGIRLPHPITDRTIVGFRLHRAGRAYPEGRAVVAWTRSLGADTVLAGLAFAEVPIETRLLVEELCLFELQRASDGSALIRLHGDITEATDFSRLAERLEDERRIEFNMREVRYLSSGGVRRWCMFLQSLGHADYSFRHASLPFASQAAMVPSVIGRGRVVSFEAPYHCDTCDRDDIRLLEARAILRERDEVIPPTLHCATCGGELAFDDVPWRFFAFLDPRGQTPPR